MPVYVSQHAHRPPDNLPKRLAVSLALKAAQFGDFPFRRFKPRAETEPGSVGWSHLRGGQRAVGVVDGMEQ